MTKKELKYYLKVFNKIQKDIEENKTYSIIYVYGRKKKLLLPKWIFCLKDILFTIYDKGDELIRKVINLIYLQGFKDKEIINKIPISESGFYRMKSSIEDFIFDMYISLGYVNKSEIIRSFREEYG